MLKYNFLKKEPKNDKNLLKINDFWNILVVDDDQYIHDVTTLVLSNMLVDGKLIKIHHAYSATDARKLLLSDQDFCVAFIDIVMEADDAGLVLVKWIRNTIKDRYIRLILRTGQPGFAPEEDIIHTYDVNDYRTKTEFTALKMRTAVQVGIRGYRDILTIDRSLESFKKFIISSTHILKIKDLELFATASLENFLSLLGLESSVIYIVKRETDYNDVVSELVLARSGKLGCIDNCLFKMKQEIRDRVDEAFMKCGNVFNNNYFVGYCCTSTSSSSVLYVEFENKPDDFNTIIAELYATTIILILENLTHQQQIERSQRELLYIVGESVEARSKETGHHVKRTALMCKLLAERLGLPESYCNNLHMAAPLHDIGKIAIPEAILHKPGKLDAAEWEVMKTHAEIGGTLMNRSDLPIAKLASRLARYHHENWDGTGYPEGLSGETIPLEARIMAIVDVIDALGSSRSYKLPWPQDEIIRYIQNQSGLKFAPQLVQIASTYFDQLMDIRKHFPD